MLSQYFCPCTTPTALGWSIIIRHPPRANCIPWLVVRLEPKSEQEQVTPGQEIHRYDTLSAAQIHHEQIQVQIQAQILGAEVCESNALKVLPARFWWALIELKLHFSSLPITRDSREGRGGGEIGVKIKASRPIIKTSENQASTVAQETANERISRPETARQAAER